MSAEGCGGGGGTSAEGGGARVQRFQQSHLGDRQLMGDNKGDGGRREGIIEQGWVVVGWGWGVWLLQ